jgi:hypothetical protein
MIGGRPPQDAVFVLFIAVIAVVNVDIFAGTVNIIVIVIVIIILIAISILRGREQIAKATPPSSSSSSSSYLDSHSIYVQEATTHCALFITGPCAAARLAR